MTKIILSGYIVGPESDLEKVCNVERKYSIREANSVVK